MKRILLVVGVFVSVAIFGASASFVTSARGDDGRVIPGQYIVVLKDDADPDVAISDIERRHGLGHLFSYRSALKGFAATIPQERLEKVKADPRVAFVSEDRIVTADGKPGSRVVTQPVETVPTGVSRIGASGVANTGGGVVVAVLDTGVDLTHPDLAANIVSGSGTTCIKRTTTKDDNGHGTHVAGTLAAVDNAIGAIGVAPSAKLVPVKVLDRNGSGSWSSVICGIDWVTGHAAQYGIKVANVSLGGSGSSDGDCGNSNNDALHKAICRSRDAGVTYVVAAGNSGIDASNQVPAAYDDAVITVSALADSDGVSGGAGPATGYGADDTFASFSNYGSMVDLGAPGVDIYSTWKGGGYKTISGTSMASPHVSGAAALYISAHPGSSWIQVRDGLKSFGEILSSGHTDPSGRHPEPVASVISL